jgi:sugar lactone lactonase YvrE
VAADGAAVKAELVHDARALLGEGPVWDERTARLHWVDILAGLVHRYAPSDGSDLVLDVGQPVSAVGLGARGGLVLALRDGFGVVPAGAAQVETIVPVEQDITGNRMNDGGCDPSGRFWAGTMATRWEDEPGAGALYVLEGTACGVPAARAVLSPVTCSNGIGWSPDGQIMYYTDSALGRVDAFDFDAAGGLLTGRRPFVTISAREGVPDGLEVDADGAVWVALFGAGRLRRYLPSGQADAEVEVPVSLVTSAAFGGDDLRDLYITTARHRLVPGDAARQPQAGSLFRCRPGPAGKPAYRVGWL